mgnify:CR=1 FL=1
MNVLRIQGLNLSYGEKLIFEELELFIQQGDRVALVAKNGTGKSSLFKIITGAEPTPLGAEVEIHKDSKVGYLPQNVQWQDDKTIKEVILEQSTQKLQALEYYKRAAAEEAGYEMDQALESMDRLNIWDLESRMEQILGKLNLFDVEQRISTLSGGQKKRVALTALLVEEPQLILMDEPTNHLDPDMIEWLEDYLISRSLTLLIITHDRYFLDKVCNRIVELDNGKLYKYNGNYAYYVEKKQAQIERDEAYNAKMKNLYRREKEWMSRQPKARTTKAKSRIKEFGYIEESANMKREKEKLTLETVDNRLGTKVVHFHHVHKSFGEKVILSDFNYKFKRFDKIGIVGGNGAGKTTFLEMIMGNVTVDSGEIVVGETVKFGYYQQEDIPPQHQEKRMIEYIREVAEFIPLKGGRSYTSAQMLERFLFPKDQHFNTIETLSGGEKKRLTLIKTLMQNPNFLILDEPTNDLDILTLNVLQAFIEEFVGSVLVVSHDRYFMDNVVDQLFIFEGDGLVRDFNGTYSEYRMSLANNTPHAKPKPTINTESSAAIKKNKKERPKKLSFNEQRRLTELDEEIPKLEALKKSLIADLQSNQEYELLQKINQQLTDTINTLDDFQEEWFTLMERLE